MKMRLKKYKIKKRKNIRYKILMILLTCIFFSFLIINYINKNVTPNIINYATLETRKIATIIINRALTKQSAEDLDINKLITTSTDNNGKITGVDFNPYIVNKTLSSLSSTIQLNLKRLEHGEIELIELPDDVVIQSNKEKLKKGIIYEVPLGLALNNSLLANIGPKIPIRLNLVGDIETTFKSKLTDYGINNALLELIIHVKITEQVLLPVTTKKITIESDVPVAIKLIEGSVPEYFSGNGTSSKISIPIQE